MLRAQHTVENLSGRSSRHVFFADERYRFRTFVTGDPVLTPIQNLFRSGRLAIAGHDNGVHAFAPFCVRYSDHSNILHLWMSADQGFDLGWIYVLAAGNDHIVLAVDEKNVPLLVAAGEVPHAAIISTKSLLCLVRHLPIAVKGVGVARKEFAWLAVRHVITLGIEQSNRA